MRFTSKTSKSFYNDFVHNKFNSMKVTDFEKKYTSKGTGNEKAYVKATIAVLGSNNIAG